MMTYPFIGNLKRLARERTKIIKDLVSKKIFAKPKKKQQTKDLDLYDIGMS